MTGDILATFQQFYENVYASRSSGNEEDLTRYLAQVSLASLSEVSRHLLDQPITLEELERALQLAPNDKALGLDGLEAQFYKLYKDALLPHLLAVFQEVMEVGLLPHSMRKAIIVLLLKPGKDPSSPGSYRLISLLSVDVKLLAKVLWSLKLSKLALCQINR